MTEEGLSVRIGVQNLKQWIGAFLLGGVLLSGCTNTVNNESLEALVGFDGFATGAVQSGGGGAQREAGAI